MPIETLNEFLERNGGKGAMLRLRDGEWLLPTGARLLNDGSGLLGPRTFDPPADPEERLGLRNQYYTALRERYEAAFHQLKAALLPKTAPDAIPTTFTWDDKLYGPAPGRDGVECLQYLRDRAVECRNAVADLDRQYANLPSVRAKRAKLRAETERRERVEAEVAAVKDAERDAVAALTLDESE